MTRVGAARAAATDWVERNVARLPWFHGAYFAGSTVGLPDQAELPSTSDIDVVIVSNVPKPPAKPGKLRHGGVLVEISCRPWQRIVVAEDVLASYHLAGGLRTDTVIADPTGELRKLQHAVSCGFAERRWVRARCADARRRSEALLRRIDPAAPWHEQVTNWLFGTGITTHVLLVAALRNPTVRLRYSAVRDLLQRTGHTEWHERLLAMLGADRLTETTVRRHLTDLAEVFDTAAALARTRFPFSADITPTGRVIVVDGARELIDSGHPRRPR
ncbi:hypothetical protein [Actinophytocola sediminis]